MSHTMDFWKRVIKHSLRQETKISEQFSFMPGRTTMKAISYLDT